MNRCICLILVTVLLLSLAALTGCSQVLAISDQEQKAIIDAAVAYQTDDNIYHADTYDVTKLSKGDIIYGTLPGQSVFYTDQATVNAANCSYKTIYQLTQIRPHPTYGYRTKLGKYEVLEDMYVACGKCMANKTITIDGQNENLGEGGGFQYVVFDYKTKLKLLEETDLHE